MDDPKTTLPQGIRRRGDSYEAVVKAKDGRKPRKSFRTLEDAVEWRDRTRIAVRDRTIVKPTAITFKAYAEEWLKGARTGVNLTRDLNPYKPSTLRSYSKHIQRVYPHIGSMKVTAVELDDLQDTANLLLASGLSASSVRNTFDPIRKVFARALRTRLIAINPCAGLELKAADGHRDWVDTPERVARALAALPDDLRPIWTIAFHAGLRLGEIQALRWRDVDFDRGTIDVHRGWDQTVGAIKPKTRAAIRNVPMSMVVRRELRNHLANHPGIGDALLFPRERDPELAFTPNVLHRHTRAAWTDAGLTADWAADGMNPPGLHDARHHCLTHWGRVWDIGRLHQAAGHSTIAQSQRYLHVPPDRIAEDAAKLDAYFGAP
jgi:integrase